VHVYLHMFTYRYRVENVFCACVSTHVYIQIPCEGDPMAFECMYTHTHMDICVCIYVNIIVQGIYLFIIVQGIYLWWAAQRPLDI